MRETRRVRLSRPFPVYKQLATDNSCGPRVILMAADYFAHQRGRRLYAWEWSRVLELTMKNDLTRDQGTSRIDLARALRVVGLRYERIRRTGNDGDRETLRRFLTEDRPVILECKIPYRNRPAKHYVVLVAMDDDNLRFADPFPHPDTRKGSLRAVRWEEFQLDRWAKGLTVWGKDRWAVGVGPTYEATKRTMLG